MLTRSLSRLCIKINNKYLHTTRTRGSQSLYNNRKNLELLPEKDILAFETYKDVLAKEIRTTNLITKDVKSREYMYNIFSYNVQDNIRLLPYFMIALYKDIAKEEIIKSNNQQNIILLAWCYEIMKSAFIISDDLGDLNAINRNGKPCWHRLELVGEKASNDAALLYCISYRLLRNNFGEQTYFFKILELWLESSHKFFSGSLHKKFQPGDSFNRYYEKANQMNGLFTFYYPFLIVHVLADKMNNDLFQNAKDVFLEIGKIFQMQDDYIDVFEEKYSGRIGTSIASGYITWPLLTAYNRSSTIQREILHKYYGKSDLDAINKIKNVYVELDILNMLKEETTNIKKTIEMKLILIDNKNDRDLLGKYVNILLP